MQPSTEKTTIELTSQPEITKQVAVKSPDHERRLARLRVLRLRSMDKWIVFASVSCRMFLLSGSFRSNGVLLDDLVHKLNSSHSLVAWAFSIQSGIAFMAAPITRMLLKVFTYRQVAITGGLMVGAGYVYCGLFAVSIVQLFVGYIVSGIGHTLTILPSYLALQEQFWGHFPTASSASTLFQFVGMSSLPLLVKVFEDAYGVNQSLLLFGAIMWHLVACGVALRVPHRLKNLPNVEESQREKEYHESESKEMSTKSEKDEEEEEKEEISPKNDITQQQTVVTRALWLHCFSSVAVHRNFAFVLIFVMAACFCTSSWSIFLVSHGKAQGLTDEFAVLLTTAGGVGGLIGKVTGTVLFHFHKMNPYVCCFPYVITGLAFLICALVRNAYVIFGFTFVAGLTQGLSSCGMYGTVPMIVCKYHLPQAFALLSFSRGLTIQCSGLFSGLLHDAFGSTRYVFGFNALLCFLVSPLMFLWIRNEEPVKQCRPDITSNRPISEDNKEDIDCN